MPHLHTSKKAMHIEEDPIHRIHRNFIRSTEANLEVIVTACHYREGSVKVLGKHHVVDALACAIAPAYPTPESNQMMRTLAAKLAEHSGQPWSHIPGIARGLCLESGIGYRIIFEPITIHGCISTLRIEMLRQQHEKWESWPQQWPHVDLSGHPSKIALQLEREVLPRTVAERKKLDEQENLQIQSLKAIALNIPWLRVVESGRDSGNQVVGSIGTNPETRYIASPVPQDVGLVNISLLNVPIKIAREVTQLISQNRQLKR